MSKHDPHPAYPKRPPQIGEQLDWPMGPVDFSGAAPPPPGYRCTICHARDVRLWRESHCTANAITLHCFDCAILKNGGTTESPYEFEKGKPYTPDEHQIAGLVPAVPTSEGDSFWGFSSVPAEGCVWWQTLDPRRGQTILNRATRQAREWRKHYEMISDLRDRELKLLRGWIARTHELEERLRAAGQSIEDWRP